MIVVVGNVKNSRGFLHYLKERDLDYILVADSDDPQLTKSSPTLVLSFSETGQLESEKIKQKFGLKHRDLDLINLMTKKDILHTNDLLTLFLPKSVCVCSDERLSQIFDFLQQASILFPVVVKPTSAFNSAGVSRVDSPDKLERAIRLAVRVDQGIGTVKRDVIIEEYLTGEEMAVDGIVYQNVVFPLVYHQKYPQPCGPYFHESAYISQVQCSDISVRVFVEKVIQCMGLDDSAFHMEIRKNDNLWYLIECAPRFSGLGESTSKPFQLATGISAYKYLIDPQDIIHDQTIIQGNNATSFEFDFKIIQPMILPNIDTLIRELENLGITDMHQYKSCGEYILPSPYTLDPILTLFHKASDVNEAKFMIDTLLKLEREYFHE